MGGQGDRRMGTQGHRQDRPAPRRPRHDPRRLRHRRQQVNYASLCVTMRTLCVTMRDYASLCVTMRTLFGHYASKRVHCACVRVRNPAFPSADVRAESESAPPCCGRVQGRARTRMHGPFVRLRTCVCMCACALACELQRTLVRAASSLHIAYSTSARACA